MAIQTARVLPTGTLTFLFTDIEGSTQRWEHDTPQMRATLARHDALIRKSLEAHGATVFKTVGDAFCAVFPDAQDAVAAAVEIQQRVGTEDWGPRGQLRVRIALHTGTAETRDGDYFGPTVNRVARLLGAAAGGQVVLSDTTERLVRDGLPHEFGVADLGDRALKGLAAPVRVFQLSFPGMVPLFGTHGGSSVPNNLTEDLSAFIGRAGELRRLQKILRAHRLLTIVGPGGVGKTRIALHLARTVLDRYASGVWFVELSDPTSDVAVAVAAAMQLPVTGRDPLQTILQHAGARPLLLVLDDSEQNLQAIAAFVRDVLAVSSHITIVATSRERLHVEGEQCFSLEPFDVPDTHAPLEELRKSDVMKLMLDRIRSFDESFALDRSNASDIAAICEQLDGIPLALELAAARLRTLAPSQVLERLKEQFVLLTGGDDRADHHRTLRKTIEWSYKLLDERERRLFARLAIFRSPFTLEAVEAVCCQSVFGRYDVFDVLAALVEKSFVRKARVDEIPRFRMLHTIAAYAAERLDESGEMQSLSEAHFAYHRQLIGRLAETSELHGELMDVIERTHADVFAALEFAFDRHDPQCAALALNLTNFWIVRSYFSQAAAFLERLAGSDFIDQALRATLYVRASGMRNAVGENAAARKDAEIAVRLREGVCSGVPLADALSALAGVHSNMGEYDAARPLYERALALYREASEAAGQASSLMNLSIVETGLSRFDIARDHAAEAIRLCAAAHNQRQLAWAYGALGNAAHQAGDYTEARTQYNTALEICRSIGYKTGITTCLNHLSLVALQQGHDADAQRYVEESLNTAWDHSLSLQLADAIEAAARIVAHRGDENAARLFGSVDAMRRRMCFPFLKSEQAVRDGIVESFVKCHSGDWYENARRKGETLELSAVFQLARTSLSRARVSTGLSVPDRSCASTGK